MTVSRRNLEEEDDNPNCRVQETEHSLPLDTCMYDVGGVDTSCPQASMKNEVRIAHYVGNSMCKDDCSETCKWLCGEWSRLLSTTLKQL